MGYLLAQIFFCLLIAFAIGLAIGWLLRALRRDEPAPADNKALADARARISQLERELAVCRDDSMTAPPASPAEVAAAQAPAVAAGATTTGLFGERADAPVDDLKAISGIGPTIETQLAGIGITTYRQIARLTAADITRIDDAIEVFQGRIEREEWIEQAARLHQEKYGDAA